MTFEKIENQTEEKEDLYRYTYRRYDKERTLVFECEARGILVADKLYEEATGNDPSKDSHIGCSIKKIEEKDLEK